jgi:hypothetical protein
MQTLLLARNEAERGKYVGEYDDTHRKKRGLEYT